MYYDKKIKYLDEYERGERVQNAGFVRLEAIGDKVNVQLCANKLRMTDNDTVRVVLCGKDRDAVVGEMQLEKGRGILELRGLPYENLAEGIRYDEWYEIRMQLPGDRMLKCVIMERPRTESVPEPVELPASVELPEVREQENRVEASMILEDELIPELLPVIGQKQLENKVVVPEEGEALPKQGEEAVKEQMRKEGQSFEGQRLAEEGQAFKEIPFHREQESGETRPCRKPTLSEAERPIREGQTLKERQFHREQETGESQPCRKQALSETERPIREGQTLKERQFHREQESGEARPCRKQALSETERPAKVGQPAREQPRSTMAETKWQQLVEIYPHIRPFKDHREYLKIMPQDLVVLNQNSYPLNANSFLLHGYYNYEHLILTKQMCRDGECFFVGVPGNFYQKEKQVAVLFGFESFEGVQEPARNGDFGYYMIPVEL